MAQKCPEKKDVKMRGAEIPEDEKPPKDKMVSVQCSLDKGHKGQHKANVDLKPGNLKCAWNTVKEAK